MSLDPRDFYSLLAAAAALSMFAALAGVLGQISKRRFHRRLRAVYERAKASAGEGLTAATQSIARLQSTTPQFDRVARRWLPRREILVARLARTGRTISIAQYAYPSSV